MNINPKPEKIYLSNNVKYDIFGTFSLLTCLNATFVSNNIPFKFNLSALLLFSILKLAKLVSAIKKFNNIIFQK